MFGNARRKGTTLAEKPPVAGHRKEKRALSFMKRRHSAVSKEYQNIKARLRHPQNDTNVFKDVSNVNFKEAVKKVVATKSKTGAYAMEKPAKENVCPSGAIPKVKLSTAVAKTPTPMEFDEFGDPNEFTEYVGNIHKYLKTHESKTVFGQDYLTSRTHQCTNESRSVLLDWLISVQCHLRLNDETLHLTACMVDKFLCVSHISLEKLQLLGITCLLIASKVEERYAPEIDMLCFLTDYTYSKKDVIRMEIMVLKALKFDIFYPSCVNFYDLYSEAVTEFVQDHKEKVVIENIAKYIMDLSLCSPCVLNFPPSLRTAAALSLARKIVIKNEKAAVWTTSMVHATGYTECDMLVCMHVYAKLLTRAPEAKETAARQKYSSVSKYQGIARMALQSSPAVLRLVQYPMITKV